jgi:hypothetical protein
MDYLGKGEMLTSKDVNKFAKYLRDILCVNGTFQGSLISAHVTMDQHFTCCVYIFVQCTIKGSALVLLG